MELAQLIAPGAEWGKAWLAAHWDRKLKKQDYEEIDLVAVLKSMLAKRSLLSLRTTGHLLIGICKIFAKKCQLFEEESTELRTKLMMAFTVDPRRGVAGDDRDKSPLRALRDIDPELTAPPDDAALLGGKRHVARLEDITLRAPPLKAEKLLKGGDDLFGAMSKSDLDAAMRELRCADLLAPDVGDMQLEMEGFTETLPLVMPMPEEVFDEAPLIPGPLETDTPAPLAMDLGPGTEPVMHMHPAEGPATEVVMEEGLAFDEEPEIPARRLRGAAGGGEEVAAGDAEAGPVVPTDAGAAKRRRRSYFICDEATEIPKDTYQGYVNDRSAITRKTLLDYSVLLPHYSPNLPNFTTTFTDLCGPLREGLQWGFEVAEKRRRLAQEAEFLGSAGEAFKAELAAAAAAAAAASAGDPPGGVEVIPDEPEAEVDKAAIEGEDAGHSSTSLLLSLMPKDLAAAAPPAFAVAAAAVEGGELVPAPRTPDLAIERLLLENAPTSMGAVVTGSMDKEDQTGNSAARVGYSGRTEKMHRYLAWEFKERKSRALSYEQLCKLQSDGRRELIAGCFFELLVLKTNGVIGLQQEQPLSDIKISKAAQWAK